MVFFSIHEKYINPSQILVRGRGKGQQSKFCNALPISLALDATSQTGIRALAFTKTNGLSSAFLCHYKTFLFSVFSFESFIRPSLYFLCN